MICIFFIFLKKVCKFRKTGKKIHKKTDFFEKSLQIRQNSTNFLGGSQKKKYFFFPQRKNFPTQDSNLTRAKNLKLQKKVNIQS